MTYQALARKWRPRQFEDMVGQAHVLQALRTALSQQRLHHAYLFTGTRGVGKTTTARIFAKALNCETGVSATPCGRCAACLEVDSGRFVDLIEVDAASRTKVEDTRDLLDNVQYLPTRGRYKVYLIDEVHMLSNSSFNALLKTLEEPPPHVIFLLATTDPQKLPATVLSRCLQFHLKALSREQINGRLEHILQTEAVPFDAGSLTLVARAAEGSLRDALSLLDQAIAHGEGALRADAVRDMLGYVEQTSLAAIVAALAARDVAALLAAAQAMANFAPDFDQVLAELMSALHGAAVLKQVPDAPQGELVAARDLAAQADEESLQLWYQIALQGRRDLPFAPSPREGFEMTLLRMLAFRPHQVSMPTGSTAASHRPAQSVGSAQANPGQASVQANPVQANSIQANLVQTPASPATAAPKTAEDDAFAKALSSRMQARANEALSAPPPAKVVFAVPEEAAAVPVYPSPSAIMARPKPSGLTDARDAWEDLVDALALTGLLDNLARNTACLDMNGPVLELAVADAARLDLWTPQRRQELCRAFEESQGRAVRLELKVGIPENLMTPQQRTQVRIAERQAMAEWAIHDDPLLREILTASGGQIVTGSITPLD